MNEAIYKQPLVLFLGAGASADLGKMTSVQFLDKLQSDQSGDEWQLLMSIREHVQGSAELGGKHDIEAVLDFIESLTQAKKSFEEMGGSVYLEKLDELARLGAQIKDRVVSHFSEMDAVKAATLHVAFLPKLAESKPLPLFTTNYDVAIEKTSLILERIVDGFQRDLVIPEWRRWEYENYKSAHGDIILFKLHGSVDWVRTPGGAIQRVESGTRDPHPLRTIIAYPSRLKREIHEEPFRTNYDYLLACLLHAKVCAVLGFSFRDQEIVEEFRQAMELNKELQLLIIDPNANVIKSQLLAKLSESAGVSKFERRVKAIGPPFTAQSAEAVGNIIARTVGP